MSLSLRWEERKRYLYVKQCNSQVRGKEGTYLHRVPFYCERKRAMSFTRAQFATDIAHGLGNTNPSQEIIDFIAGWSTKETNANSGARFNLLNTTQPWVNSTDFNTVHVKNYANYQDGIAATVVTIRNGFYPALNHCLSTNDNSQLGDNPSSEVLHELSTWSGGDASKGYGLDIASTGVVHLNDSFDYGSGNVTPPTPKVPTQQQRDTAVTLWNSVFVERGQTPPPTGSGIFNDWLGNHISGKHFGAPLTHEIDSQTWDRKPMKLQIFSGCWCEWVDGAPNWYGVSGKLN